MSETSSVNKSLWFSFMEAKGHLFPSFPAAVALSPSQKESALPFAAYVLSAGLLQFNTEVQCKQTKMVANSYSKSVNGHQRDP